MTDREKELQLNNDVFNTAASYSGATRPTYAGTFEGQLQDIYDKIANREQFSYDLNADPLYKQYKDKYIQQGKLAMKDTMGQAAALTGGYGNTYSQQVGQQAYDAYLQNLGEVIPELYGMAYQRYQDEGDNLLNMYGMVGDMRDQEYGRYRDELSDYNYGQEVERELEDLLYNRRVNEENTEYSRRQSEEQIAWERQQKAYNNLVQTISTTAYQPSDAELAAAGMSRDEAEAIRAQAVREWSVKMDQIYGTGGSGGGGGGSSGGGGGGGGGGSSGGYRSGSDVAEMQRQLNAMGANLDVDGVWGPKTEAAYQAYMGGSSGNTSSGGGGYTLQDLAGDVAAVNQSGRATYGQVSAVVDSYRQAAKSGNANFTEAELNKYVTDNHLPDQKASNTKKKAGASASR